ncbi:MAG TPA: DNA polymerase I [Rhabdochlamydiaceae bacterium]|jgi:DNA polymerase-1
MSNLYVVDALNFLFRAYYAIGPMTNPKGESTNALYGFIRSIFKIVKDFSPEYFIVVFDGPDNKQMRKEIYSEYKSHRASMPEDIYPQIEKALYFCEIAGIASLSVPGVEADDTMGSIAQWAEKKDVDVFLCSSDKDLCQLVTDKVRIINPHKDNLLVDRAKVKELFGIYPEQMIDYLAMVGDASDNIPGLEGFGPKTAAALLGEYGTLHKVLAHAEKMSGKKKEVLLNGKEIALLSQKLATIYTEVAFPKNLEFFHLREPDLGKIRAFYHGEHFMSLLKEMTLPETTPQKGEDIEICYHLVDAEEALEELIARLSKEKRICIDTETTDVRPMQAELVGIGFGVHLGEAWYVPMNGRVGKKKALAELKGLLEDPQKYFIGHNIKYELHVLANVDIALGPIAFDTMVASYLISPHLQRHGLDERSLEKFGKVKIPIEELIGKGKKQMTMDTVTLDKICTYCCEDVDYTLRLEAVFKKELEKEGVLCLFEEMEIPLIPVLMRMERHGIYVDVKVLEKMSEFLRREIKDLEEAIYEMAGEKFNLNSPKQLSGILFEKMKIRSLKKTTTGFSTAADVLEELQEEAPIVKKIIEYRLLEKLRSTYVDALPGQINPKTGRIHCTFNQSVAATGRLSCQDPNLQNIPVRSPLGKKIREAFKPQHPHSSFLSADYSQIELRLLAHLSEDPALLRAFRQGEDIHAYTASLVFDIPLKEVTPQMRYQAKAVNFGIIYGQSPFGLSQELGIQYNDAVAFIETYFKRYKKVKEYLNFCKESVQKTGRAVTLTGRQRPIPEIYSKNPMLRAQAERLAVNTPLQGTQADLIKLAMIRIDALLYPPGDSCVGQLGQMILQIHDALLFEVPDAQLKQLAQHVKEAMETIMPLSVPLVVDISFGKNWGEC